MECPHCGHSVILGDDICEQCGGDLINSDPPKPVHGRLHEAILEDPISQLNAPQPILLEKTDTVDKAVAIIKQIEAFASSLHVPALYDHIPRTQIVYRPGSFKGIAS